MWGSETLLTLLTLPMIILSFETPQVVEIRVNDKVLKYSMSEEPAADSPLVRLEKAYIRGSLDLESFVKGLSNVGKFVRIAYNGIGAGGPEFQDLQNRVQVLVFNISKLCDKSYITIAQFKLSTEIILNELMTAYQLLLNNREGAALISFLRLAKIAEKMVEAADNLKNEFVHYEEKVNIILAQTTVRSAEETIRIKKEKERQEKKRMLLKQYEKLMKECTRLEAELRSERLKLAREQGEAFSSNSRFLKYFGNTITSHLGLRNLWSDGSESTMKDDRYRRIEKLENEKRLRKLAAYQSMAELAYDIEMAEGKENLASIAVGALQIASLSMKKVIYLLHEISVFWNNLQEHCRDTAGKKIDSILADISEEERKMYWSSMAFKQRMYRYMSKWVALHSVCSTHLEHLRRTQDDFQAYMREDPTYEESRKILKTLVEKFEMDLASTIDLASTQEWISQQNLKCTKEVEELHK